MAEKQKVLVLGSLAYDSVMKYDGLFKDVMVQGNYNVSINASDKEYFFGGCGANICYNLSLFGLQSTLMTVAGKDFGEYRNWLEKNKIDYSAMFISDKSYTSSSAIVTDNELNQITIFHPGAMEKEVEDFSLIKLNRKEIGWCVISPENPERMLLLARECKGASIPYLFAPAQTTDKMRTQDLLWCINNASILVVNEYESEILNKKLTMKTEEVQELVPIYVETHSEKGSRVKSPEGMFFIKAVKSSKTVDPTGCGDSYRAGLIAGLMMGKNIREACEIASMAATYDIETRGTQSHRFTIEEFKQRFENNFGYSI